MVEKLGEDFGKSDGSAVKPKLSSPRSSGSYALGADFAAGKGGSTSATTSTSGGIVPATSSSDIEYMLQQASGSAGMVPYRPPTRYIIQNGRAVAYDGDGIVSRDGKIVKDSFYSDEDVYATYATAPAARQAILKKLVVAGFLDKNAMGNFNSELSAIKEWLEFSNTLGIEQNWALDQKIAEGGSPGSGGVARTYRTSNTLDLVRVAKAVAKDTIGREVSDIEAQEFASMYQQQEINSQRAGGGVVQDPMSLETAAQTFAQQSAPQESAAYGYLGYMNKLFDMIGVR